MKTATTQTVENACWQGCRIPVESSCRLGFSKLQTFPLLHVSAHMMISFQWQYGKLVGGFNPFEKYDRQIGHLPQFSG